MATGITLISQPLGYMPVYNTHWWYASSTNTGQTNFKYYITVTDLITSASNIYAEDAAPDLKLYFNSATFARTYITWPNPDGLYGFQKNTGAIRKIRVNIAERWDVAGVPTVNPNATNYDYIVWNGVFDFLDYANFINTNPAAIYQYSTGTPELLTNNLNPLHTSLYDGINISNNEKTFANKRSYLTFLGVSPASDTPKTISIRGYDSNGNLLTETYVTNPYCPSIIGSSDYRNDYVFIDVGYKGLANMPAGQVTAGTWPIPVSTFAYYIILDVSPTLIQFVPFKRIDIECEARYDVLTLHYLGKLGQWETINCSKLSERTTTKQVSDFKVFPYSVGSFNAYTYSRGVQVQKTLNVDVTDSIKVNTDWVEPWQMTALKECFSSFLIYMDDGVGLIPMKCKDGSYKENKKYNTQLLSASFELEYTHTNHRQIG
jgi:hypothetical protein